MKLSLPRWALLGVLATLTGCTTGPDYKRPETPTIAQFQGDPAPDQSIRWQVGWPRDALPKGAWWEIYHDVGLNALQTKARTNNQSLKAALARLESARATVRQSRAALLPQASTTPSYSRNLDPASFSGASTEALARQATDRFTVPFDLSYEVDLWGRVRRSVEASKERAKASAADYENLLLSLQAELTVDYFSYAALQRESQLLTHSLNTRRERVQFIRKQVEAGKTGRQDLVRAESDLQTTEAELENLREQSLLARNAISLLVGEPAPGFALAGPALPNALPVIPVGLPSDVLERRPDVAAAERTLAARNAEIGVAKASFFPIIRLTGQAGVAADDIGNLFHSGSRAWSYGPSVQIPLFQGGKLIANYDQAKSDYAAAIADYRQQVLVAFREVEDALDSMDSLQRRHQSELAASAAAKEAERIARARYEAGSVAYLELLDAQRTALESERAVVRSQGRQFQLTVALIKALGGSWKL